MNPSFVGNSYKIKWRSINSMKVSRNSLKTGQHWRLCFARSLPLENGLTKLGYWPNDRLENDRQNSFNFWMYILYARSSNWLVCILSRGFCNAVSSCKQNSLLCEVENTKGNYEWSRRMRCPDSRGEWMVVPSLIPQSRLRVPQPSYYLAFNLPQLTRVWQNTKEFRMSQRTKRRQFTIILSIHCNNSIP